MSLMMVREVTVMVAWEGGAPGLAEGREGRTLLLSDNDVSPFLISLPHSPSPLPPAATPPMQPPLLSGA